MTSWIPLNIPAKNSCHFYRNQDFTRFLKLSTNQTHFKIFQHEFRIMKELENTIGPQPYFPHYYECCSEKTSQAPYIIMEFVQGNTLTEVLSARKSSQAEPCFLLSIEELYDVCEQLFHALRLLAHNNILYFDLSTDNIILTFIDGRPQIKLIDFTSCYLPISEKPFSFHVMNNRVNRKFPPPLKLQHVMMHLFVRLFFSSDDSYDQYLTALDKKDISPCFFERYFHTVLDLVLAPETQDLKQLITHAEELFENGDYLFFLNNWHHRLQKQFRPLLLE